MSDIEIQEENDQLPSVKPAHDTPADNEDRRQHPEIEVQLEHADEEEEVEGNGRPGNDATDMSESICTDQRSVYSMSNMSPVKKKLTNTSSHLNESASISFLRSSFEQLISIKDIMKKHQDIVQKSTTVIGTLKAGHMPEENIIFEPLKLACEQSNIEAKVLALDCLSKIFTFNLFNKPIFWDYKGTKPKVVSSNEDLEAGLDLGTNNGKVLLIEAAVNTVISCFEGEGTDERVELQIVRVLTGTVVNESMPIHGKVLLQVVRQINNIFLLSLSPVNQSIAQAALIQIVDTVYGKVSKLRNKKKITTKLGNGFTPQDQSKGTLVNSDSHTENDHISNGNENGQSMTLQQLQDTSNDNVQLTTEEVLGDDDELYVKDAFLIFRSISNLASKVIEVESLDMRSHQVRVKMLSLHIIHMIIKNYSDVFADKEHLIFNKNSSESTALVDGIRKYLCLALSRNATSQLSSVYEITMEIYWLMIKNLRSEFKFEIPVFLDEIYFPVCEMKTSVPYQKRYVLNMIYKICSDPKILVEFYLNYDCDTVLPNLCEKIIDHLAKHALQRVDATTQQKASFKLFQKMELASQKFDIIPELNSSKLTSTAPNPDVTMNFPNDFALKMISIDCIVSFLQSLNISCGTPLEYFSDDNQMVSLDELKTISSEMRLRTGSITSGSISRVSLNHSDSQVNTPTIAESEETLGTKQFDSAKQRKTALLEGIRLFNFSPKKGIAFLERNGFLNTKDPSTIAKFIIDNPNLDKTQVGEYLGGSKEENISVMHAFVDIMDFKNKSFLDALRSFLQHFRLPGESQVIDRFMLKFAEKYVNDNPKVFANADTVYVLSYSVILLNTDQHSAQVKKRMTLDDFIKNNKGIDDGKDLDPKFLEEVYKDIQNNEIILNSEQQAVMISNDVSASQPLLSNPFFGRNYAKEAYTKVTKVLSKNTENTVISLGKNARKNLRYFTSDSASNPEHVRSMFDNLWMSLLAGLTPPFKDYDDEDVADVLLLGIRLSIHMSCIFDIDYARTSFIRALVQFTNMNNPEDMKDKNIKAIYTILEIAIDDNSYLKSSWRDIFITISQVERLRLLSKGVDGSSVPDLINARLSKKSLDIKKHEQHSGFFSAISGGKKVSVSEQAFLNHVNQKLPTEMVNKINTTELDVRIDKVFSKSSEIQGDGIFDFVSGLVEVAREEIKSSGDSQEPRMFCLQKMVDFCYYNMSRIRLQWSEIWKVMNQEFNEFGCSSNNAVAFFAIDSLRQLSERFFSIEELAHFKFQKEFLRPFDYIIINSPSLDVKQMVLDCIQYLILKNSKDIRSGWTTILETLAHAAYCIDSEKFVSCGLKSVQQILETHLDAIEEQNGYSALVECLCEYGKNERYQKVGLRALSMINLLVEKTGNEVDIRVGDDDYLNDRWFPLLLSFHSIIMEGTDLEVRSKALNFLFDGLITHGKNFDEEFWRKVWLELLFPIFDILKRHGEINIIQNEGLWVWLSSTMIQALRKMVLLFTTFFNDLHSIVDDFMSLLISCICQDNDAISKIGISCLKDLIIENITKFDDDKWERIIKTFSTLFKITTAKELFELDPKNIKPNGARSPCNGDENNNDEEEIDNEDSEEESEQAYSEITPEKTFSSQEIVVKCVLHLHMIQLLSELFDDDKFYACIPYKHLISLSKLLEGSYQFSRDFNEDYNLRVRLWNSGVVDKLPNLLKQETSSVGVYISILFRLYCDEDKVDNEGRVKIVSTLIPLSNALFARATEFQQRQEFKNLQSWIPVVIEVLQALTELKDEDFRRACPVTYGHVISLFQGNISEGLQGVLRSYLTRVGSLYIDTAR